MVQKIAVGIDNFETLKQRNVFYIDKTHFIKEWWDLGDQVTLITRPRRFGKTLNMSMLECFFSLKYANRGDLFEGLSIWEDAQYRNIQGTYPVVSLSFANMKENTYQKAVGKINHIFMNLYDDNRFLLEGDLLTENEKRFFRDVAKTMDEETTTLALQNLSKYLSRYYGKKVLFLLDEYDTPMQEAYTYGYWEEIVQLMRGIFNATFKTNPYMERVLMTGITRVSKESMFSDFNNPRIVSTTSPLYTTAFGFTEQEVFDTLDNQGMGDQKEQVKAWYDGFTFGETTDIYNPWSIIGFLGEKQLKTYWANTSSNSLAGLLVQKGDPEIKKTMEDLLEGGVLYTELDEQVIFNQLDKDENAIWSLLLASGYLKVISLTQKENGEFIYCLALTNKEVQMMFRRIIKGWFGADRSSYNGFIKALLKGDVEAMNDYMNDVALACFSYFDNGKNLSKIRIAERFYHGFVLGLMVELREDYEITSNRESGYGRYDVTIKPREKDAGKDAIIIEFKVKKENTLEDTVQAALEQIENMKYDTDLIESGIKKEHIRHYGFAFEGSTVLIG